MNTDDIRKFLHPGEKQLLQRIIKIAIKHHDIQEFIKLVTVPQKNVCETENDGKVNLTIKS